MPQPDPNAPPESIVLGQFVGIKNIVAPERLQPNELQDAKNVDIDDGGQVRRRRGYKLVDAGNYHSIHGQLAGKMYGVKDGYLGIIRPNRTFSTLGIYVGDARVSFTEIDEEVYFSSTAMSGIVNKDEQVRSWGETDGQGFWDSPVYAPTPTLGAVGGKLLGDPVLATEIEVFHGRIYLAADKVLWRTELYRYAYVDRTKGFYQFEHSITMVMAVDDGLYVGTTGGLYFLQEERILMREFGSLQLQRVTDTAVYQGSGVGVLVDLAHPNAAQQAMPTGTAIMFLTDDGVMAGFNSGETYNLTEQRVILPTGVSAAGLFRQDMGDNTYVVALDSGGQPTTNARFGDYAEAEIRRFPPVNVATS